VPTQEETAMSTYDQTGRFMEVATPLSENTLLLVGLSGQEGISQLFTFELDLIAENAIVIPFERLLGQPMTVTMVLADGSPRYFSGICARFSQGDRADTFTSYRAEIVPQFWLLTRRAQSRIFQQLSVPQILERVLAGLTVSYNLQGTYNPRDYCVQYRETDFNFASRLMEEEGIFYYFEHNQNGHTLVIADTSQGLPRLPGASTIIYEAIEGGVRDEDRIYDWRKTQELRAGKYTLWDYTFELPTNNLQASQTIQPEVSVGQVRHQLSVASNDSLELYDYPGEYAQRYDGVDPSGGDQSSNLQNIFTDNQRTVTLRMQEETVPGLIIQGSSNCRQFASGYHFMLTRHFNADGQYLLTAVRHSAQLPGHYRSGGDGSFSYRNSFTCIPFALPFRPRRVTPKPFMQGPQTAVVVGPDGEEIFTDKYGRVKVQLHWDRQGQNNANSSCWVRVGTPWAGQQWGMIHIPRIGQEVIVDFEEGDPDQPIIICSVYNANLMPPYTLPDNKTQSGVKSRSTLGGTPEEFNELRFEDKKGSEDIYFHAQKDFHRVVENNDSLQVGNDQTITITNNRTETVQQGDEQVTIAEGSRTITISKGDNTLQVQGGNRIVQIDQGDDTLTISMGNQTTNISMGQSSTTAMQSITLTVGENSITIDQTGITIKGMMVTIQGQVQTQVQGTMTQVNGDAMLQLQGGITMIG
jgi:type VI secretion system secreted protein VgrG